MGVRTHDRSINEPKQVIPPKPIFVNDGGYRGQHPDAINYPHLETITDGKRSLELRAFTTKGMEQLRRIAEEQFLSTLEAQGLNCAVLCEKRRDSGTGRITLGVCFGAGKAAQGARQAIMLRKPDADDPRVAYTLLHETAHLTEDNHGAPFKAAFAELVLWAVGEDTPFTDWRRELIGFAKGDSYAPPTPPSGGWDDYLNGTPQLAYEVSPDESETLPAAALTVDASYGVKDWGFSDDLVPKRNPEAVCVDVDLQELVDYSLDHGFVDSEDTGNGGFQWDTDLVGIALAELYDLKLRERGVAQRRINKLRQTMDWGWGVKQNLEAIEPVLDAAVRARRAQDEEVPF